MMQVSGFAELTPRQQQPMLIAMKIRNAMEGFHVEHLSDNQMADLNPIIRRVISDTLVMIERRTPPRPQGT